MYTYKTAEVKITTYSDSRLGHPVKMVKPFVNFKGQYIAVELLLLQHFPYNSYKIVTYEKYGNLSQ